MFMKVNEKNIMIVLDFKRREECILILQWFFFKSFLYIYEYKSTFLNSKSDSTLLQMRCVLGREI